MKPSHRAGGAVVARALSAGSLAVAAALLVACGEGGGQPASQVAAKVNDEEISVHQINYVMQRQPGVRPEQAEEHSREILERLIDQELLVQKARELKIDRDPRAVQEIEAARRDILARLYVERATEGVAKPTPQEIRAYYEKNPALFEQRRIYSLREVAIDVPADAVPELRQQLERSASLDEFIAHLEAKNIRHNVGQVTRAAEQLPLELLDSIYAMRPGESMLVPTPVGAQAIALTAVRESPVGEEQARPAIERYIANERRRTLVEQDVKSMREQASVEYVGKFAEAEGAATDAAGTPAPAADAQAGKADSGDAAAIQKGIQGLK